MPGQQGSEVRIRTHIVQVRMDDGELARLDMLADASGVTRAETLRRLTYRTTIRAWDTDRIVTSLSRVGNLLNQLARVANATGELRDREGLRRSLDQLAAVVGDIGA